MGNRSSLGDLGWKIASSNNRVVRFEMNGHTMVIDLNKRLVFMDEKNTILSFAEVAAILGFIIEDAIY